MQQNIQNKKILSLLQANDITSKELGFQLCASLDVTYSKEIRKELQTQPILCLRYGLEKEYTANLELLNIAYHNLSTVPQEVIQLKQLNALLLHNNLLTKIPEEIALLEELDLLQLEDNQLNELPDSLIKLEKLTMLSLAVNKFTSLPPVVKELKNLSVLDLGDNPISQREQQAIQETLPTVDVYF